MAPADTDKLSQDGKIFLANIQNEFTKFQKNMTKHIEEICCNIFEEKLAENKAKKLTAVHRAQSTNMPIERTFVAVKPDGVQRNLTGEIIKRFEARGFKLVAMKMMQASEDHCKQHYFDLSDQPFFDGLVKYMASHPVCAMVWEGTNVIQIGRKMMGETNPFESLPGTIRGDYCIEIGRNVIHGSDSVEAAKKEINLWFKPEELCNWQQAAAAWIYE